MILPTKNLKMGFMSLVCSWKAQDGTEKSNANSRFFLKP